MLVATSVTRWRASQRYSGWVARQTYKDRANSRSTVCTVFMAVASGFMCVWRWPCAPPDGNPVCCFKVFVSSECPSFTCAFCRLVPNLQGKVGVKRRREEGWSWGSKSQTPDVEIIKKKKKCKDWENHSKSKTVVNSLCVSNLVICLYVHEPRVICILLVTQYSLFTQKKERIIRVSLYYSALGQQVLLIRKHSSAPDRELVCDVTCRVRRPPDPPWPTFYSVGPPNPLRCASWMLTFTHCTCLRQSSGFYENPHITAALCWRHFFSIIFYVTKRTLWNLIKF